MARDLFERPGERLMLLRWMVNNLLRETAQNAVMQAVSGAVQQRRAAPDAAAEQRAQPPPPCDIAIIFALGIESGGTVDLLSDRQYIRCPAFVEHAGMLSDRRIVVADSGVGRQAASRATKDLISIHHPQWVISAGFAGALTPELRRGHILMADRVVNKQGDELGVGLKIDPRTIEQTNGLHVGRLLTVDRIVRTPKERRKLAQQYSAVACDMETAAVAAACSEAKTRFLSVRIISDAVDDRLPPEVDHLLGQKSLAGKLGAATGAIFKRPGSVKDLWKLREDALKTSDRLAIFLAGVVPQLDNGDASAPSAE